MAITIYFLYTLRCVYYQYDIRHWIGEGYAPECPIDAFTAWYYARIENCEAATEKSYCPSNNLAAKGTSNKRINRRDA